MRPNRYPYSGANSHAVENKILCYSSNPQNLVYKERESPLDRMLKSRGLW